MQLTNVNLRAQIINDYDNSSSISTWISMTISILSFQTFSFGITPHARYKHDRAPLQQHRTHPDNVSDLHR